MEQFLKMLSFDSTSGRERDFALWLASELQADSVRIDEVGDGSLNLLLSWGVSALCGLFPSPTDNRFRRS